MPKKTILKYMHEILSYNVAGDKQYKSRYDGFNGELHFSQWFRQNKKTHLSPGGVFVPLCSGNGERTPFENSIYLLSVPLETKSFFIEEQFQAVSQLATQGQFLIRYAQKEQLNTWKKISIPGNCGTFVEVPFPSSLTIFSYNSSNSTFEQITINEFWKRTGLRSAYSDKKYIPEKIKNTYIEKLSQYEYNDILDLYVSRFTLDGLCAIHGVEGKFQRGSPLDIDCFVKGKSNQWMILEVKEKYLSKNDCFGMDTPRISSLLTLSKHFSTRAFYVVRQVDNRTDRNFIKWMWIDMLTFNEKAPYNEVEGGHGMRGENTKNPTRLCDIKYFKEMKSEFTS